MKQGANLMVWKWMMSSLCKRGIWTGSHLKTLLQA